MVRHQIEFAGSTAANGVCFVLAYEVSAHHYYSMHIKEVKDSLAGKPDGEPASSSTIPTTKPVVTYVSCLRKNPAVGRHGGGFISL